MKSERAVGLVMVLVIGVVWASRGLMGVFWGVVSIAAIRIVYWTSPLAQAPESGSRTAVLARPPRS